MYNMIIYRTGRIDMRRSSPKNKKTKKKTQTNDNDSD